MFKPTIKDFEKFLKEHAIEFFHAEELLWFPRLRKHILAPRELWENIVPTAKLADAIRREWGGPIRVLSGYRTKAYNVQVGGAPNSQHLHFRAMDLTPADGDILEFRKCVSKVVTKWRADGNLVGMGTYNTFIHIDVGFKTRSWAG